MTKTEAKDFEVLLKRKEKAMKLSTDELEKYAIEYTGIVKDIQKGLNSYIEYCITDGENDLKEIERAVIGQFKKTFRLIHIAISGGEIQTAKENIETLKYILLKLREG